MVKIMISGCNGKMGQVVSRLCASAPNVTVVAGTDLHPETHDAYPVYADPMEYGGSLDCVIDFSHPSALDSILRFCHHRGCGAVLATTGYSEEQKQKILEASKDIRVFQSANMSVGVNVLLSLVEQASRVMGGSCDIEIVEKHHNQKLDAPSGTALMIADAAASALPETPEYVYDRHTSRKARDSREIGISSVRGGTIVGEHEILFAGTDEVLEIKHTAYSREIFANGAVRAACFLARQTAPGLYTMKDLVSEVI